MMENSDQDTLLFYSYTEIETMIHQNKKKQTRIKRAKR